MKAPFPNLAEAAAPTSSTPPSLPSSSPQTRSGASAACLSLSPRKFVPERVFVTVGTTSFDELIAAVLEPSFLLLLLSLGCQHLVLQIGRGTLPARPPLSVPRASASPSPALIPCSSCGARPTPSDPSALPSPADTACEIKHPNSRKEGAAREGQGDRQNDEEGDGEARAEGEHTKRRREAEADAPRCSCSRLPVSAATWCGDENSGSCGVSFSDLLSHPVHPVQPEVGTSLQSPASPRLPSDLPPRSASEASSRSLLISFFRFLPSLEAELAAASLVISHCGAGTVFQALRLRKRLVAVVNASLMNNHQLELGRELERRAHCLLVSSLPRGQAKLPRSAHGSPLPVRGKETDRQAEEAAAGQNHELHTRVKDICLAVWSAESPSRADPLASSSSSTAESTHPRQRGERSGAGSADDEPRWSFRSFLSFLWPRSRQGHSAGGGQKQHGREEKKKHAEAGVSVSRGESQDRGREALAGEDEPSDWSKPLRLVPLPPADLSGFYAAVEDAVGLHPVYGDGQEAGNTAERE
ncbi:glycosyltransferase family 28 C-terminal domain-containing protein [Neospora caninum Liverpool]|uniref:UDP-N-acetylglucosamine transferase subunit ALG13 n=1 Tax=Neospora caninum (strain Liverpool) TaxID=572307 RepID=F0VJU3_NEOCL|nr:glycosyltransferase family 28 C-terminal domain-containing protein [Neospora caninum Liverpool]CBZ54004.1 glycosyltransferase family 28 C-terminal domain-containing protein [Neospora caninum Liverpool]CEL68006.1 TPA: glycosyltransferase family 28 C-terminal domain-containing protein, putative [Neospora caninum Liverpool]|eukprot:XP_003884036.1 glycosyltransferase family 28 C-terminal domain-containing protein [Neospora caninum Liverpool]